MNNTPQSHSPDHPDADSRDANGAHSPCIDSDPDVPAVDDPTGKAAHNRSVPALIRALRSGQVRGPEIAPDDRRMCVEFLSAEGLGAGEIAELMQVTERTILRDRAAIRKSNALTPDPAFASEMAGLILRRSEASAGKLRRLARDKDTPPAARIEAEAKAFALELDTFVCLQKCGYLPIVGGAGSFDGANLLSLVPQLEDMAAEAARLKGILAESGSSAASTTVGVQVLDQVLHATTRLQLSAQIESVKMAIAAQAVEGTSPTTPQGHLSAPSPASESPA